MYLIKAKEKILDNIEQGLKEIQNPYLALSWGKDSVTMLYFVRMVEPNIKCVYINSGYCLPDTYELRNRLIDEWDLNYTEINQPYDYVELCREYGLPHHRDRSVQSKIVKMIKIEPMEKFAAENNYDGVFLGLRLEESLIRRIIFYKQGWLYKKKNGLIHCSPLWSIGNKNLWDMIEFFKIPYSKHYNNNKFYPREKIRGNGWLTTDGVYDGYLSWLRYYYPEYYFKLVSIFPEIARDL